MSLTLGGLDLPGCGDDGGGVIALGGVIRAVGAVCGVWGRTTAFQLFVEGCGAREALFFHQLGYDGFDGFSRLLGKG